MGSMKGLLAKYWLFLLTFAATVVLAVITSFKVSVLNYSISHISFYCMLAVFLGWGWQIILFLERDSFNIRSLLHKYGVGMLFSLLMTTCIFVSLKPEFRVLADETNLLSVSRTMLYEKRVDNITQGKWYYFNLFPTVRENAIRPYMFPFVVHIVHAVTGFRASNPFVVNFILMAVLFFGIFVFVRDHSGAAYAYAAVLLTAAQPVITLAATSAGMDLMQIVFLFYTFVILKLFLQEPAKDSFLLLWAHLLMVANIRYEGPLFLVIILAGLILFRKIKLSYFDSCLVYVTPFVLLPVFWQRFCLPMDHQNPAGVAAFSFQNVLPNSLNFLRTLTDTRFYYPYAAVIDLLGLIAAVYFIVVLAKKTWPKEEGNKQLAWITLVCLACYWLVITSHHMGTPLHPTQSRYFGLIVLSLSMLCIALPGRIPFFRGRGRTIVLLSAAIFLFYNPTAIENRFMNSIFLGRQFRHEMDFLKKVNDRDILIISDRPNLFTAYEYGAVNFPYANADPARLLQELDRHLFKHIYVFQEIAYVTGAPTADTWLNADYTLEPLSEIQLTADSFIRISEAKRKIMS